MENPLKIDDLGENPVDMNHESSWLVDRDPEFMTYEIIPI